MRVGGKRLEGQLAVDEELDLRAHEAAQSTGLGDTRSHVEEPVGIAHRKLGVHALQRFVEPGHVRARAPSRSRSRARGRPDNRSRTSAALRAPIRCGSVIGAHEPERLELMEQVRDLVAERLGHGRAVRAIHRRDELLDRLRLIEQRLEHERRRVVQEMRFQLRD
jgi:hypothetical protein